jgi:16S rRNA processing protein RimM
LIADEQSSAGAREVEVAAQGRGRHDETPAAESMVVLGRVTGAYGVKGWLRILPLGDDPLSWKAVGTWWLSPSPGTATKTDRRSVPTWHPYTPSQCRLHGGELVAQLKEVADRDAAEALKGALFGVPRAAMPEPEDGTFYWGDLIGLTVIASGGAVLGRVDRLMETGANDVLAVIDESGRESLLPFVAAVIKRVDLAAGRIEADWDAEW